MTRATGLVVAALALAASLAAVSCSRPPVSGPPQIALGIDVCDACGMAISDTRYAAAALVVDDEGARALKFDDIGCLARWEAKSNPADIRHRWVHDGAGTAWIEAESAAYAKPPDLVTPMGSGLVAFRSRADAAALGGSEIGLLTWSEVLESEATP
jgi:copper chaperone NosL